MKGRNVFPDPIVMIEVSHHGHEVDQTEEGRVVIMSMVEGGERSNRNIVGVVETTDIIVPIQRIPILISVPSKTVMVEGRGPVVNHRNFVIDLEVVVSIVVRKPILLSGTI